MSFCNCGGLITVLTTRIRHSKAQAQYGIDSDQIMLREYQCSGCDYKAIKLFDGGHLVKVLTTIDLIGKVEPPKQPEGT